MALAMKHGFNPAIKHLYRHSEAKHGNEERGAFLLRSHVCWYSGKTPHPGLSQIKASFDRTGWTSAQHELFQCSEMVKLQNMWGDQTASRLVMARQFIRELEFRSPGVVKLLERTGLGNNSRIVAMVVAHAERLAYRNGNTK